MGNGRSWSFFLREKGSAPRTGCWRRRWAPRTCTCDDLSTTTHPLQHRGLELDRQETSATEVCESSFSFFLREKVGREGGQGKTQIGEESLSGQREPQQYRGLIQRIKQVLLLCMCPRLFAGKVEREKVVKENSSWVRSLFKGNVNPNSIRVWSKDQTSAAAVHVS